MISSFLLALGLAWSAPAQAADEVGTPVTIRVTDATGVPIQTAVIRYLADQSRHRVNTETGESTESVLYLPDGSELVFDKGMELEFEVSAPGYTSARIKYYVRKRKNLVPVILEKMELGAIEEGEDEPLIQFGRDKPID